MARSRHVQLVMPLGAPSGTAAQHDKTGAPAPAPALTGSLPAAPLGSGGKGDEVVETKWGPLGAGDRDFISKVRPAGLWELPAGQQAMQALGVDCPTSRTPTSRAG